MTGAANGSIRIHCLTSPYDLSQLDSSWSINTHDNQYGCVSTLAISFDDQYVISGGDDGNVFIYKTNFTSQTKTKRPPSATLLKPVNISNTLTNNYMI